MPSKTSVPVKSFLLVTYHQLFRRLHVLCPTFDIGFTSNSGMVY